MKIKDIKENYYFETLNESHYLNDFDCGDEDLNDFLKNDALIQQDKKLNLTKLVICEDMIIGYVSLLTDRLTIKNIREDRIKLDEVTIVSGNKVMPTASVKITIDDEEILNAGVGVGPVDAAINALKSLDIFKDIDLIEYHVDAITGGTDAFIDVIIKVQQEDKIVSARGTEPDIINASVKAYIAGVNRLLRD
jgi:hypothetical protein